MRSIRKAWPAALAAAALAVALPACGDDETERDVNDAVEDVQREGEEAGRDVSDAGKDLSDKAEDAGKDIDKRTGVDEDVERETRETGRDVEREAGKAVD